MQHQDLLQRMPVELVSNLVYRMEQRSLKVRSELSIGSSDSAVVVS